MTGGKPLDPYHFDPQQAAKVDREEEDGQAYLDALARGETPPDEPPRDDMPFTAPAKEPIP